MLLKDIFFSENIVNPQFQEIVLKGDKMCENSTDAVSVDAILLCTNYRFQHSITSKS